MPPTITWKSAPLTGMVANDTRAAVTASDLNNMVNSSYIDRYGLQAFVTSEIREDGGVKKSVKMG